MSIESPNSNPSQLAAQASSKLISRRNVLLGIAGLALTGDVLASFLLAPRAYTYQGHTDRVNSVAWSPDSTFLASASLDGTAQIWEPFTGKRLFTYKQLLTFSDVAINSVTWSPDGQQIAFASGNQFQIWNIVTSKARSSGTSPSGINTVVWSPDGRKIATGEEGDYHSGAVRIWDAATSKLLYTYPRQTLDVRGVAWSSDSQRVASTSGDQTAQVWDASTGDHAVTYHHLPVYNRLDPGRPEFDTPWMIAWSPDNRRLATGYLVGGAVQIWDAATGKYLLSIGETIYHGIDLRSLTWSPDGKYLATAGGAPKIWNATTGKHLFTYEGHTYPDGTQPIWSIAWSPDGKYLASASSDKTVQVWSAP